MTIRSALFSLLLIVSGALHVQAAPADDAARHILAPTGTLRVALYIGTPTSVLAENDLRGVGYDLGQALARRLNVPFQAMILAKNADVLDAVKDGRADAVFTNASGERAAYLNFSQPYIVIELGYLAGPKTKVARMADIDNPGVKVGITAKSSSEGTLSRDLKNAEVVGSITVEAGMEMLRAGKIDVFATNKATLFGKADGIPGARVLEGSWGQERHALGIPKGREAGLPYVRAFIVDAITKGLVKSAVERAGLRGAVVPNSAR